MTWMNRFNHIQKSYAKFNPLIKKNKGTFFFNQHPLCWSCFHLIFVRPAFDILGVAFFAAIRFFTPNLNGHVII